MKKNIPFFAESITIRVLIRKHPRFGIWCASALEIKNESIGRTSLQALDNICATLRNSISFFIQHRDNRPQLLTGQRLLTEPIQKYKEEWDAARRTASPAGRFLYVKPIACFLEILLTESPHPHKDY